MLSLYNVRFQVEFGCGSDTWRIFADCPERSSNETLISTPIEYDSETDVIKTVSGSVYKIENYVNKDKFIEEIKDVLENKGYQRC
jgi:hypothetical protein